MTRRSDGVALRIADYVKKQSVYSTDYVNFLSVYSVDYVKN